MKDGLRLGLRKQVGFFPALSFLFAILAGILISPEGWAQVNRDVNSYVLFAFDELTFKGGGNINGNIGVISVGSQKESRQ